VIDAPALTLLTGSGTSTGSVGTLLISMPPSSQTNRLCLACAWGSERWFLPATLSPRTLPPMDPVVAQRRLDIVWRLVLRSVLLVEGALLIATVTVPMLGRDTDPDDSDPAQTLRVVGGLAAYLGARPSEFGDRDSHPFAVPGGVWLTRILLVVLLVGLLAAATATCRLALESTGRPTRVLARVGGGMLIVSVVLLAMAQTWLSDDHVATPLQPGLLIPLAAGVWLLSATAARAAMDELDSSAGALSDRWSR
jgi:hypothetical protein